MAERRRRAFLLLARASGLVALAFRELAQGEEAPAAAPAPAPPAPAPERLTEIDAARVRRDLRKLGL